MMNSALIPRVLHWQFWCTTTTLV